MRFVILNLLQKKTKLLHIPIDNQIYTAFKLIISVILLSH